MFNENFKDFLDYEINRVLGEVTFEEVDEGVVVLEFENLKELVKGVNNLIHFGRSFEDIFMRVKDVLANGSIESLDGFTVEEFDSEEYVSLLGFDLDKRDYEIYESSYFVPYDVLNYTIFRMGINFNDNVSVIDPYADNGAFLLEFVYSYYSYPMFYKNRFFFNVNKFFSEKAEVEIPRVKSKDKLIGLVQDSKDFRNLKENINKSGFKIKVSQFDLDWVDVKYHKDDFDYVFTYLPSDVDDDELNHFFYMMEFICKKKIAILFENDLDKEILKKNKLKISYEENLEIDSDEIYNIYIIEKC